MVSPAFAIDQGVLQRNHDRVSVRPELTFALVLSRLTPHDNLGLYVENEGPGLALLDPLSIRFSPTSDEEKHRTAAEELPSLGFAGLGKLVGETYAGLPGPVIAGSLGALAPGEIACLFGYPKDEVAEDKLRVLSCIFRRVSVDIPYRSVYADQRTAVFRGANWRLDLVFPCP